MSRQSTIKTLLPILLFSLGIVFVINAWTSPTSSPPRNNVPAPINVGLNRQTKEGTLIVGASSNVTTSLIALYGNVGIGTTAPGEKLEIRGGAGPTSFLIAPGELDNRDAANWVTLDIPGYSNLRIWDHLSVWGNVGIGTTAPAYKLDVAGALRLQPSSAPPGANGVIYYDASLNKFRCYQNGAWVDCITSGYWTASGNNIYNTNSGNVGIGTTAPQNRLHVSGGEGRIISEGTWPGVWMWSTQTANRAFVGSASANNDIGFWTSRAGWGLVMLQNGNVGIGTTAPNYKLHVAGNVGVTDTIWKIGDWGVYLGGTNQTTNIVRVGEIYGGSGLYAPNTGITLDSGASSPYFKVSYRNSPKFYIDSGGNVGIGTTAPSAKLHIYGGTLKQETVGGWNWIEINRGGSPADRLFFGGDTSNRGIWSEGRRDVGIYTEGTARLYITAAGNVGIGTTKPTHTLTVAGSLYTSGGALISGMTFILDETYISSAYIFGNVGIGTIAPGYKLEVQGSVGAHAYYYISDISLKKDVKELGGKEFLEKILLLKPVQFKWKENEQESVGLLAQEVEKIFPELVKEANGLKYIDYGRLTIYLIEAIKELKNEIEILKSK